MRQARWLAEWRMKEGKPMIFHCVTRVVDRQRVLGAEEKEKFRGLMRMMERFTGCQVLSYCMMDDHVHLLLEIPNFPSRGLSDEELLNRVRWLYPTEVVAGVAGELEETRWKMAEGLAEGGDVVRIHQRYTARMHDMGNFMKGLLQRYTQWHNGQHGRRGTLWEDRYQSVIVEDGVATRTLAGYIDLNPVRAGIVKAAGDYAWSSYGEATGKAGTGEDGIAQAGLVRAAQADAEAADAANLWAEEVADEYRKLLEAGDAKPGKAVRAGALGEVEVRIAAMLRKRVRHFSQGGAIGSKEFVNAAFEHSRERFGPRRKDGARKMRGAGKGAEGVLWSLRDLRPE